MATKPTLIPLYAAEDETKISPVLSALKAKGFAVKMKGSEPEKEDAVLFFLSEHVREDAPEIDALIQCDAEKRTVIPVRLDGSKPPAVIDSAILAKNAVFLERYTPDELAERIADALIRPSGIPKKVRTALILLSAVLLLSGIGIWFLRNAGKAPAAADIAAETASPVPSATPAPAADLPVGIPAEDVERIAEIVFVGDTCRWYTLADPAYNSGYTFSKGYDDFAYRGYDDDGAHWYSTEDGHEFPLTRYDDLSWLKQLTNLKHITFCAIEAEIPDLSGLTKLATVRCCDNRIGSLEWLKGSSIRSIQEYRGSDVTDFSPLSLCGSLDTIELDLGDSKKADFSGFCPPSLRVFSIDSRGGLDSLDLSRIGECMNLSSLRLSNVPFTGDCSLSGCKKLYDVTVRNTKIRDLSFVSGCTGVQELYIEGASLGTLDGIGTLTGLVRLNLQSVDLHDISAITGCAALEEFCLGGWSWNEDLTDLTPLTALPRLKVISTHTSNISNLDFLNDLMIKDGISLDFSANITDYSGLSAIRSFKSAHFNVNGRDFTKLVMPYIQSARFGTLDLYNCANVDLSLLPEIKEKLSIRYGDLASLDGLSQPCTQLRLENCQYLTSLSGFSGLSSFGGGKGDLCVEGCPRLTDWSALHGMRLNRIELTGTYSIPDFSKTGARYIRFDHVDESALPDLSCLKELDKTLSYDFDLAGQADLPDLLPLFELHGGHLVVPPHLQAQAEELVHDTRFQSYEVRYPDSGWNPDDSPVVLLSLAEAETLPKSVLRHVTELCMAGDVIFDSSQYWIETDWSENPPFLYLRRNGSSEDERIPVENGTELTDLSVLQNLTGLKSLRLYRQPVETLEGIQYLGSLEDLALVQCGSLTDASAAFTLQNLFSLDLSWSPVSDLSGLKNLYALKYLDLGGIDRIDPSALSGLPADLEISLQLPLLTYEAFCKLPPAVLNSLRQIEIAGGYVFAPYGNLRVEADWDYDPPRAFLCDGSTGSRIPLEEGPLSDLAALPEMQKLDTLRIAAQPLTSLEGLEKLPSLRAVEVRYCYGVSDLSPLLSLPEISRICVAYTSVGSIEGVQTLKHLTELNLSPSDITDLSPLGAIDYTYAETPDEGGWIPHFTLSIDNMQDQLPPEQYGFLAFVPYYDSLNIHGTDWNLWMDALEGSKIRSIWMSSCSLNDEAIEIFAAMHPEIEQIHLSWNPDICDLSPLLELPNLREVWISENMRAARESLSGGTGFFLGTEG